MDDGAGESLFIRGGSPSGKASTTDYNNTIRQTLLDQLKSASGPVDESNPDIAPALSAQRTQSQRDEQASRAAIAERAYAGGALGTGGGLDSGEFKTDLARNREAAGATRQNFAGNLVFKAAQAKRQQLTQMLATASQYGLTDQGQQIQAQIAKIDADLRSRGLQQQGQQFGQSLAQQHGQFGDALGLSYAQLQAQANRDAVLAGLG